MEDTVLKNRIDGIEAKLDVILGEIELQRRHRRMIEDLRDDLTRVGTDVFRDTVHELDDLSDTLDTRDFTALAKQLLRNVNNLRLAFQQLESMRDFLADFTTISGPLFNDLLHRLDDMDRKGYFELLRAAAESADTVTSGISPEDVKRLASAAPVLVSAGSKLADPEILAAINRAAEAFDRYEFDPDKAGGILDLMRLMADRDVRRGMAWSLGLFKVTAKAVAAGESKK